MNRIVRRPASAAGRAAPVVAAVLLAAGCAASPPPVPALPASPPPALATGGDRLLPIRQDSETGRIFLTLPRLGEEMLYLNTLAAGLGTGGLDRGQVGTEAVVRFERRGARILMVRPNTAHRAVGGDEAAARAVAESFPYSVVASFAVQSEGPAGIVIDATDYFLSDVYDVVGRARSARLGSLRIDAARSYVDPEHTGAFPVNTEVRSVLTYVTDDPSAELRRHAPDGRSVTLQQHHSFLRLPETTLAPRDFDPRAGIFGASYFDFSQPFDSDYRQRGIARWRLEPTDTAAYLRGELVEPVRPIVYYLDRGVPEPYRTAFIEGGNWWNGIFEAAGWRNAFRVELMPEGVDPMDARYPVLYWVHRQTRGPSVGPSYRDPRSGEILSTVIRMDSYRSLVDNDVYMGLVPAAGPGGLQMSAEAFALARRRQHVAHEIGHTIGMAHNFVAASQGRSSVMDYPYPLIELDPQGRIDISRAYSPSGGAHDTLAIRYAYTWYPDPAAEAAGLKALVRSAEAAGLRFVADAHAGPAGSYPEATRWIEGASMTEALERTVAVRERLIESFDERAAMPGEPLAVLNRRYSHVYLHHRYALEGATKAIGGMRFNYALAGETTVPTEVVPAAEQRHALNLVLANLAPERLRTPAPIAALIPPVPFGFDGDLAPLRSAAGPAFDPLGLAHSLAQEIVDGLLHPERAARVVALNLRDRGNPTLDEVVGALLNATWGAPARSGGDPQDPALLRIVQRASLDGLLDLAGSPNSTPEVRSVAEHHLARLRERIPAGTAGAAEEAGHRAAARRDIDRYFAGEDDPARRPRPAPIPLPWP